MVLFAITGLPVGIEEIIAVINGEENEKFCSRARHEELKKRSVCVHEHFSPTRNAAIGQKNHFWMAWARLQFVLWCPDLTNRLAMKTRKPSRLKPAEVKKAQRLP